MSTSLGAGAESPLSSCLVLTSHRSLTQHLLHSYEGIIGALTLARTPAAREALCAADPGWGPLEGYESQATSLPHQLPPLPPCPLPSCTQESTNFRPCGFSAGECQRLLLVWSWQVLQASVSCQRVSCKGGGVHPAGLRGWPRQLRPDAWAAALAPPSTSIWPSTEERFWYTVLKNVLILPVHDMHTLVCWAL